ncbi:hypothetical protein CMI41_01795 [Candidatus Pacearchaeota archaeon]|jgi:phosphotransacetylase|nr:hypothetical protein [Candidatus Pacearchaeota archaeon]|tara:strand:- start:14795 stop:15142 length:348 start_codon:yes stop_codon:yes gene_type:complete
MDGTNNFHCYFPGGRSRPEHFKEQGRTCPEIIRRISEDLDLLIASEGFDIRTFKKEKRLWHSKIAQAIKLLGDDDASANEVGDESTQHNQNVETMIRPLYERMLQKGYSERDLIQ